MSLAGGELVVRQAEVLASVLLLHPRDGHRERHVAVVLKLGLLLESRFSLLITGAPSYSLRTRKYMYILYRVVINHVSYVYAYNIMYIISFFYI